MLTRTLAAYAVIFRSEVRDDSKRRNQAAAARTIGIKRIDAARSCQKPWLALVLHVSRITPGKCTAGLNKSVIR